MTVIEQTLHQHKGTPVERGDRGTVSDVCAYLCWFVAGARARRFCSSLLPTSLHTEPLTSPWEPPPLLTFSNLSQPYHFPLIPPSSSLSMRPRPSSSSPSSRPSNPSPVRVRPCSRTRALRCRCARARSRWTRPSSSRARSRSKRRLPNTTSGAGRPPSRTCLVRSEGPLIRTNLSVRRSGSANPPVLIPRPAVSQPSRKLRRTPTRLPL